MTQFAALLFVFAACQLESPPSSPSSPSRPSSPPPFNPPPPVLVVPDAGAPSEPLVGSVQGHAAQGELLAGLFEEVARLHALGRAAQDPVVPPCEQGYAATTAIHAELVRMGVQVPARPSRGAYLAECAQLPRTLQDCLVFSRLFDPTCDLALRQADAATSERFLRLAGTDLFK